MRATACLAAGPSACYVYGLLTFADVTLSGRHHFVADYEGEDWCTHCLDVDMLVTSENGAYRTVIDHHLVNLSDLNIWNCSQICHT